MSRFIPVSKHTKRPAGRSRRVDLQSRLQAIRERRMAPTRSPSIWYVRDADRCWRLIDVKGGHYDVATGLGGRVGPIYATERELLADLDRFFRISGF